MVNRIGVTAEMAALQEAFQKASKFSHANDFDKPVPVYGTARSRQARHLNVKQGRAAAGHAAAAFWEITHSSTNKKWAVRAHLGRMKGLACLFKRIKAIVTPKHALCRDNEFPAMFFLNLGQVVLRLILHHWNSTAQYHVTTCNWGGRDRERQHRRHVLRRVS